MQKFERDYAKLLTKILDTGSVRATRNAETIAVFGKTLKVKNVADYFPIIQGRKMFPKGIFGEFAAMVRKPKHIDDFTKWGCNYWADWAEPDGSINVDYGNAWFDFEGVDQVAKLKEALANDPTNRRMLISGWHPGHLEDLSLPCCHHLYQFFVEGGVLHMSWTQRSVDMMVGLPSDIVFAAAWLISLASEFDLVPGDITFFLGDCHIYTDHKKSAHAYVANVLSVSGLKPITYSLTRPGADFCTFEPTDIKLDSYGSCEALPLKLFK